MSVAALPPPSLQPRMAMPTQSKRPVMMPRPSASSSSSSNPALAARPSAGLKAKPVAAPPPIVRRPSSAASSTSRSTPAALPQPAAGSSKDTSSSSGKVFAKPSKEWVLPERAKPGRKVSVEEPDNVSRLPTIISTPWLMTETPVSKPSLAAGSPGTAQRLHSNAGGAPAAVRSG